MPYNIMKKKREDYMERRENVVKDMVLPVIKTVAAVMIVTAVLLLILSFLLYKLRFSDNILLIGIGIIYFLANMAGGFIIGKVKEQKRFIWGMSVGFTYFVILAFVSFLVTQSLFGNGVPALIGFICCIMGGTFGGMIS